VAADLRTKPTDFRHKSAYRELGNYLHNRRLLSLLSLKADTHFTIPRIVKAELTSVASYTPRRLGLLSTLGLDIGADIKTAV